MANGVFNIARGKIKQYYENADGGVANARLVVVIVQATGLEADDTLNNYDDLGALLAAANNEATNSGYARKVLGGTELSAAPAPDDTNNRQDLDIPDQTWTTVAASGGAWGKLLVCYDADNTSGTDSNIVPLTYHDFAVTPDGTDIVAQIASAGFWRSA